MDLPTIDKKMDDCLIELDTLYLLLSNYEHVTTANQHENRLIMGALYVFTLSTKYLVCLRIPFVHVYPGHSRFYGFYTTKSLLFL
jgi:hypothetical protein